MDGLALMFAGIYVELTGYFIITGKPLGISESIFPHEFARVQSLSLCLQSRSPHITKGSLIDAHFLKSFLNLALISGEQRTPGKYTQMVLHIV